MRTCVFYACVSYMIRVNNFCFCADECTWYVCCKCQRRNVNGDVVLVGHLHSNRVCVWVSVECTKTHTYVPHTHARTHFIEHCDITLRNSALLQCFHIAHANEMNNNNNSGTSSSNSITEMCTKQWSQSNQNTKPVNLNRFRVQFICECNHAILFLCVRQFFFFSKNRKNTFTISLLPQRILIALKYDERTVQAVSSLTQ